MSTRTGGHQNTAQPTPPPKRRPDQRAQRSDQRGPDRARSLAKGLVLLVVMVAVLPVAAYHFPAAVGKDGAYLVLSGSMEPEISPGDIIFTERVPASALEIGDVITYTSREDPDTRFTHRIVEIQEGEEGPLFVTKGDANENRDPGTVAPDRIEGRYTMLVPYYGHGLAFAQTDLGFLVMIIVPGLFLIGMQVRLMYQAFAEIEKKTKEKKGQKKQAAEARTEDPMETGHSAPGPTHDKVGSPPVQVGRLLRPGVKPSVATSTSGRWMP